MTFGTVQIGRVSDEEMKTVAFDNGQTVQDILDKADLNLESSESVKLNDGTPVALGDRVSDNARYFITANMKAGN